MKIYFGERRPDGTCFVCVAEETRPGIHDATPRELPIRLDLRNHSPTGFDWSYAGSGPSQLALALLADALGDDDTALNYYQQFKWDVVTKLGAAWTLTAEQIREAVNRLQSRGDIPTSAQNS